MSKLRSAIWLAAIAGACLWAGDAQAVLVFVRGQDKPETGILLRQNEREVVIRQRQADGSWTERTIPRAEVTDLIETVSRERLAALSVDRPGDYRDYAEELTEKRQDPEAQETALRLYLIAGWLDPEKLGKSSMLGMIKLSRSPAEERAFRAMAFLLDPAHDRSVLQAPTATAASTEAGKKMRDEDRQTLIRALQTVRSGAAASRRNLVKRANIRALLAPHADLLTWEEFSSAAAGICADCKNGRAPCSACDGKGKRQIGGRRINCSVCGGRGDTVCPTCMGEFATAPMAPALLAKILSLELALLGGASGDAASPREKAGESPAGGEAPQSLDWAASVARGAVEPPRSLSLTTITEFDPRLCLYRDGKWVAPEKP